jgi:hypothetical protein
LVIYLMTTMCGGSLNLCTPSRLQEGPIGAGFRRMLSKKPSCNEY